MRCLRVSVCEGEIRSIYEECYSGGQIYCQNKEKAKCWPIYADTKSSKGKYKEMLPLI